MRDQELILFTVSVKSSGGATTDVYVVAKDITQALNYASDHESGAIIGIRQSESPKRLYVVGL